MDQPQGNPTIASSLSAVSEEKRHLELVEGLQAAGEALQPTLICQEVLLMWIDLEDWVLVNLQ
jgi:hypothetical protein